MNHSDEPAPGPVFVDDSGHRRRMAGAVAALIAVAAVGATAVLTWAVFTNAPVDATSATIAPASSTTRAGSVATGRVAEPFAVAVAEDPASDEPIPPAACAVVHGTVFHDLDLNGSRQPASEGTVAGVVVELTDAGGAVRSTRTDSSGAYSFDVERPGPVRLEFRGARDEFIATPVGTDAAPWVTFPRGGPTCRVDTSVLWTGWFEAARGDVTREVGDRVWLDADGDGVQDPDELGIGGVDLALLDDTGRRIAVTTTTSEGTFRFSGLEPDRAYRIVLASAVPFDSGPLDGLEPTTAWTGTTYDGTSFISEPGAVGRDSGHLVDEDGTVVVHVGTDEPGASDHSFDLGFRPAR